MILGVIRFTGHSFSGLLPVGDSLHPYVLYKGFPNSIPFLSLLSPAFPMTSTTLDGLTNTQWCTSSLCKSKIGCTRLAPGVSRPD